MAHNIEKNDKQQGVIQAWHGLTEIMPEITLQNNWLTSWDVQPLQLVEVGETIELNQETGEGMFKGKLSNLCQLVCSDNRNIRVGGGYNPATFVPISNADFLRMVEESISGTQHKIVSVGSVRNRGRVFLSIELQGMEKFKAAGREYSAFLNYGNGHDKSSILWVNTSNVCSVCDNTFTMNLLEVENKVGKEVEGDDLSISQRHTKNVKLRLPEISKLIDRAIGVQGEFAVALDALSKLPCDTVKAEEFFTGFLNRTVKIDDAKEKKNAISTRTQNTTERLVELFKGGAGNRGENFSDVFQAGTDYFTHESSGGENRLKQIVSSEFANGSAFRSKVELFSRLTSQSGREETIEHGRNLLALV